MHLQSRIPHLRHQFEAQYLAKSTPAEFHIDWDDAALQFEECGFGLYYCKGEIERDSDAIFDAWHITMTHQLNNGEKCELIWTRFFEIAEVAAKQKPKKQTEILQAWSTGIDKIAGYWCVGNWQSWLGNHDFFMNENGQARC
jgi:hypothetical protein